MMDKMDDLDALFAAAAAEPVVPSARLMGDILADAARLQPRPAVKAAPAMGWFATLADWFGGGMSLAGLATAAITGLYLGVMPPAAVTSLTELVTGQTSVESLEVLPSTSMLWAQE